MVLQSNSSPSREKYRKVFKESSFLEGLKKRILFPLDASRSGRSSEKVKVVTSHKRRGREGGALYSKDIWYRWHAGRSVSFWEKLMRRPAHHGDADSSRFRVLDGRDTGRVSKRQ